MIRAQCVKCGETFMQSGVYDPSAAVMYCSSCEPVLKATDGHIHTMPNTGPEHPESKDCWCYPRLGYKDLITGVEQWIHNDTRPEALQ